MDGRTVNLGSRDDCFEVLDSNNAPWGLGSNDNPLVPYVSVGKLLILCFLYCCV